ncbi:endolytic transglycosylase MltG [Williamwhitmania taraxaci]|uniref:Endolytic murein transglycosylase n=1 Tax=Williamwhitmania taraxaci TaxID=1640674 RepID=A0A1G6UCE6_9BACT|nr:endolytic transglycosylase MltG [Williamwhitmania taraxaci]SDD39048.1 UPF0755 protein [Williamwhitmania taraxaci]
MSKGKKKIPFWFKVVIGFGLITIGLFGFITFEAYQYIYKPNVYIQQKDVAYICIPTGSTIDDVTRLLYEKGLIINRSSFEWLAKKRNYNQRIFPGRYKITNGMSNNRLVEILRTGTQSPVKLVFNPMRGKDRFAGLVGRQLEADSIALLNLLNDPNVAAKYGFSLEAFPSMFVPNTYEFFWNTSTEKFLDRMKREYDIFWTDARKAKAASLGLTPAEVVALASIVEEETVKSSEKPRIAGVYLNRIKKGMLLQADPTVKFAVGDFTLRRILNKHLSADSPYNTYKYAGIPPGPINFPSTSTVNAVLNAEKHSYIYFCAREDFSGYSNFASTLAQHNRNATAYRNALSRKGIFR